MKIPVLLPIFINVSFTDDFCEIDENLVITLQCTEECIMEMKDCLVECDDQGF